MSCLSKKVILIKYKIADIVFDFSNSDFLKDNKGMSLFYEYNKESDFKYNIEARYLHNNKGFKKIFSNFKKEIYRKDDKYLYYYTRLG